MELVQNLFHVLITTLKDVLPIIIIIFGFQVVVLRQKIHNLKQVLSGLLLVLLGLVFFLEGLKEALFPIGKLMAQQLTEPSFISAKVGHIASQITWADYYWVYIFAAAIGFSTTIAEPALMAVAIQAHEVSGGAISRWGLRISVAIGAAIGISLGTYRIVTGTPIYYYIIVGYIIVIIQTNFAPKIIVPIAFDSGGVTTSTVTVPLVAALGLGLASTIPGRSVILDGFGLIAFACLFPMMTVMGYAQLSHYRSIVKTKL